MATPNFTIVAVLRSESSSFGEFEAVYDVGICGVTGKAYFGYRWEKRDVTRSEFRVTQNIAALLEEHTQLAVLGPDAMLDTSPESQGDPVKIEYYEVCEEVIYEYD